MSILSDIVAAGLKVNRQIGGELVTFCQDGERVEVLAKPAAQENREDRDGNGIAQTDALDWKIEAAELVTAGGKLIIPRRGATIERLIRDRRLIYAINADGSDQPATWGDTGQTAYHLHSKLISDDPT